MEVLRPCAEKTRVMTKKLDHVPAPGTRPPGERFDVTLGQRRKPTPGPANVRLTRTTMWSTVGSPARMDVASTLNSDERDMTEKRQNAPTSLTLHEQACAVAQRSSRDEISVLHVSLG